MLDGLSNPTAVFGFNLSKVAVWKFNFGVESRSCDGEVWALNS